MQAKATEQMPAERGAAQKGTSLQDPGLWIPRGVEGDKPGTGARFHGPQRSGFYLAGKVQ